MALTLNRAPSKLALVRVLAITHGANVGPGVFGDAVSAAGHELDTWHVVLGGAPRRPADAVLVFGGAMHPDQDERHPWLRAEHEFLAERLEGGTPLLGVCLGAQLIAKAAGAEVRPAREPEVGWLPVERIADDPVLDVLPPAALTPSSGTTTPTPSLRKPSELARSDVCELRLSGSAARSASSSMRR